MSEKKIKWGFIGCGEVTKYKSGPAFQKAVSYTHLTLPTTSRV